jgi:phage-related protein
MWHSGAANLGMLNRSVEIVTDHHGDTFRCVYTVRLASAVYVLHAFQKKSKVGRATSNADKAKIMQRLREAERIAAGAPG